MSFQEPGKSKEPLPISPPSLSLHLLVLQSRHQFPVASLGMSAACHQADGCITAPHSSQTALKAAPSKPDSQRQCQVLPSVQGSLSGTHVWQFPSASLLVFSCTQCIRTEMFFQEGLFGQTRTSPALELVSAIPGMR